ncbi:3-oxoacyl-[acyl-carrier-protein] synthase-1 [Oceanihabitans sediminis]|uniref:Beta-ketoacyl synthase n=2 Tax=Pseudomonadati TaxID=3379134 RepID=A0A368P7D9_9FLAO|nr:beta-ketoacyl synthase N-terminal-like domain-containing protein [Oceanihabitans sediminis]MDX1772866.1 beta-ketoacyl synthase N-terminal-like domain-containing protein [Oceanihabitans sediminis]RBP34544.1 3-oxoacyl-[acyl-carrier-protein] synthase-1 [Oceanihabitans sediminis]RCU58210.1 beta-ketoacyl synthase [Oceanihabitans sediminis]
MTKVYVSHTNIISSLGFNTETVVENIHNEVSGLQRIDDKSILPEPFYTSLIPTEKLQETFKKLNPKGDYTRLEQMMISSLHKVIEASNIELNDRVGLIISTTKGNIDTLDENNPFHKDRAYLSELGNQIKDFFHFKNDAIVVSNACVSGILAVAVAKRYIEQGEYDHVFITSGDVITEFILSGFNSFQALSSEPCKPYDANRKGINIGEVAASVLVTKDANNLAAEAVSILGEGSCNDANHISGPSRTGEGLYRSMQSAFKQAGITAEEVDFISAHGTATMFNDEMEAIAFNRLQLGTTPLNSLKGYFGHSLGASGLVETIVGMHSLKNNTLYKSLGFENLGVTQPLHVITKTTNKHINRFLKTASGFGGCNTAVLFEKTK